MIVSELSRARGLCTNSEWHDIGWHAALYFISSRAFINP